MLDDFFKIRIENCIQIWVVYECVCAFLCVNNNSNKNNPMLLLYILMLLLNIKMLANGLV